MERDHTRRVCAAAIFCALLIRFFTSGMPEKVAARLMQPDTAAFLIYLETGRDVRFSPSLEAFSPQFAESPAPAIPEARTPPVPAFSDPKTIDMYWASDKEPDLEALLALPLAWELYGEEPAVLILHTHATESYTRGEESYTESAQWRTLDENYNMLSVGRRVAELLEENGIPVIQDRTLHDYPSYNGSYTDARKSIEAYLKEHPSIQLVLDLHRDASEGAGGQMRTEVSVDGESAAQLMLVMGANHKDYERNLSLALKLHAQLERQAPGIMRPLQLRAARFNQDLSPGALLIEVGAAGNTHDEALRAADQLARAIIALARGAK